MTRAPRRLTSAALAGIAGVHVAWGMGSTFPFASRAELGDAVVGSDAVPSPLACHGVAAALLAAAALVGGRPRRPRIVRRAGVACVTAVLGARGAAGLAGRTDVLSPGSSSPRFRRLDRMFYSPLCLALAAGAATSFE